MQQYNIIITGKVQGVWFRKYTQEKAQQLNLNGFVMNKDDGSVYTEAVGTNEQLKNFVHWLKTEGSPLSVVSNVKVTITNNVLAYTKFSIKK